LSSIQQHYKKVVTGSFALLITYDIVKLF